MFEARTNVQERLIRLGVILAAGSAALTLAGCGGGEKNWAFTPGSKAKVVGHDYEAAHESTYITYVGNIPVTQVQLWPDNWSLDLRECRTVAVKPQKECVDETIDVTQHTYHTHPVGSKLTIPTSGF